MKTMVIISDSHGHKNAIEKIEPLMAENDYVIFLGDGAADMAEFYNKYPEKVYVCNGNCDLWGTRISRNEWEIETEGHKILCCHGHLYGVKTSLERIKEEAKTRGCDIVLYGHTHICEIHEEDGITFVNPGSIYYSVEPTYAYLVLTKDKAVATIVKVN